MNKNSNNRAGGSSRSGFFLAPHTKILLDERLKILEKKRGIDMSGLLGGQRRINPSNALKVHNALVSVEPDALSREDVNMLKEVVVANERYSNHSLAIACCTDKKILLKAALEVCRPFIGDLDNTPSTFSPL